MATLIYAPEVTVRIRTSTRSRGKGAVIDVSEDISSGSVTRVTNGISVANLTLLNQNRKYDGMFSPMDTIVVYLKRLKTVLKFAGYLDDVPKWSAEPGSINMAASCTLKRLQHFLWDPTTPSAYSLLNGTLTSGTSDKFQDAGSGQKTIELMNTVAGWPKESIHLGRVPGNWYENVSGLREKMVSDAVAGREVDRMKGVTGAEPKLKGGTTGAEPPLNGGRPLPPPPPQPPSGLGARPPAPGNWGDAGDGRNMVTVTAAGCSFRVHRLAAKNFTGFVNELKSVLGYSPKVIYGYIYKPITGSSTLSNHSWGAAIDIDSERNKRYPTGAGGPYALPKKGLIDLARKWGLGWGGEWNNSKDYMHFEVIGSPSAGLAYDGIPAESGSAPATPPTAGSTWAAPLRGSYRVGARFGQKGSSWSSGYHTGTDYQAPVGTKIYSVGTGRVHQKSVTSSYGNGISIDHGSGHYTFYAHMQAPSPLAEGQSVDQNTVIGKIGLTGNTSGAHVHVEYRRGTDNYSAAQASGGIEKYIGTGKPAPSGAASAGPGGVGDVSGAGTGDSYDNQLAPDLTSNELGDRLFNSYLMNLTQIAPEGTILSGYRALMNDEPIFRTVETLLAIGMRDFCSAPNGDFIAWFPDYFGHYGMAGKMVVTPLEIDGVSGPPTIGWSDRNLKTHQFVTAASSGATPDADQVWQKATTAGVVSIEMPEVLAALLNISLAEAKDMGEYYLNRYGPRVDSKTMNNISGEEQEFFFACHLFQRNWSAQYQARVNLTFMPELFPGMLLCLPEYGIQGYVNETTDTFSLEGGSASFRTTVSCAPWSSIGKNAKDAAQGLPVGAPL